MNTWQEFWTMGNHGDYVWSSYLVSLIVFAALFVWFKWYKKSLIKQIKMQTQNKVQKPRTMKTQQLNNAGSEQQSTNSKSEG